MSPCIPPLVRAVVWRAPVRLVSDRIERFGPVDGWFERDDGTQVPLYAHYRDQVKDWRLYWWPMRVLTRLSHRVELPPEAAAVLRETTGARALPFPVRELARVTATLVPRFPAELQVTGNDPALGVERVEIVPGRDDIDRLVRWYRASASAVRDSVAAHGGTIDGACVLDVGTGSGRLAYALAGMGADEVVGVDLDPEGGVSSLEREPVRERLAGKGRVRIETADVTRLDAPDCSFDVVCSISAVEHFHDLPAALEELVRVLRPGGLMVHGVDPWYGKGGGHSLCTLDFPWGHARLTGDELDRYLAEQRPNEAADAIAFHRHGFQAPHRTLAESRALFDSAGLDVLEWQVTRISSRDPSRRFTADALRDVRRIHASVAERDLAALSYGVVARRR